MVMGVRNAVLFVPSSCRASFALEWEQESKRWHLPNLIDAQWKVPGRPALRVISYSELSNAKATTLLGQVRPDLIIADEVHNLKARTAVRTKRFLAFFAEHPAKFAGLSGTITSKSLKDYAHLSALALGESSPLPKHWPVLEEWCSAIDACDPGKLAAPMGKLELLCHAGEDVQNGFRRRLHDTHGVVGTVAGSVDCSLELHERKVKVPPVVSNMLHDVRETWARPDGEELVEITEVAKVARELASGFYYKWRFPRNEPRDLIARWFGVRKAWHKELRSELQHHAEHLDSPLLLSQAAIRYSEGYKGPLPVWPSQFWPEWKAIRDEVQHETETVWVDKFLVEDAAEWASKHTGIVWYHYGSVGKELAALTGLPLYGPGEDASEGIIRETGRRTVIASIRAHGYGKNLQMFNDQIVVNPPSDGGVWEQLLGRSHRQHQKADQVTCHVYRHTQEMRDALDKARERARYIKGTQGNDQKLLIASVDFP
jgi:hypothetical protein